MTTDTTTEKRIAKLEAQITRLQAKQSELNKQLTKAQVQQWQGRIDDLEVQMHLGAMEANEHLAELLERFRSTWATARAQMESASSTTTEVVDTLRIGLENAYGEFRKALLETKQKVSH